MSDLNFGYDQAEQMDKAREKELAEFEKLLEEYAGDPHLKVGMTFGGLNAEGIMEWIGTDDMWEQYDQLDNLPPEVINEQKQNEQN